MYLVFMYILFLIIWEMTSFKSIFKWRGKFIFLPTATFVQATFVAINSLLVIPDCIVQLSAYTGLPTKDGMIVQNLQC